MRFQKGNRYCDTYGFKKGNTIGPRFQKGNTIGFQKGHTLQQNEDHSQWRGDDVGYKALHAWVKRHLSKPKLCEGCNTKPSYDLSNITGNYTRDFNNWKYLCRSCHFKYDGINEKNYQRLNISGIR